METPLVIAVLAGTTRPARQSIHAARFVADVGRALPGVEIVFVDPREFTFPDDGNDPAGQDPRYSAIVARADAFFIVTPEYNHSVPGSLKRMLDSELALYMHKPVAFAGVSSQKWGGVRAIEALVTIVRELGLVACSVDVQFPQVEQLFDGETGALLKPAYRKYVEAVYTELLWLARTLRWGRHTVPSKYHATVAPSR